MKNYVSLDSIWSAVRADNEVAFEVCYQSVTLKVTRYESAYHEVESLMSELSVVGIAAEDEGELLIRLCPMTEGSAETILFAAMEDEDLWGET